MNVLVTGATGFVGRRLVAELRAHGHAAGALSRDADRARGDVPGLSEAWDWDASGEDAPAESLAWADAVVHLAGENVAGRWTKEKRRRIRDSREVGTRRLVAGIAARPAAERPKTLVSASAIGYYGDRGDEELTEESAPGDDFLAEVCAVWEGEAVRAAELGLRVVRARIGLVMGPGGGALAAMLPLFRAGLGGALGGGDQWWAWIHLDDVAAALRFAAETDAVDGPLNLTAPNPVRQKPFAKAFGHALGRPAILPAPAFALKLVLGRFSEELLASRRVIPAATRAAGFRFRHPDLGDALAAIFGDEGERRRGRRSVASDGDDDEAF